MKSFRNYLCEKLIEVNDSDIEMLYSPLKELVADATSAFEIKDFNKQNLELKKIYSKHSSISKRFHSSSLTSPNCKAANEINPVEIWSGIVDGNVYVPSRKFILVGLPKSVMKNLNVFSMMSHSDSRKYKTEFTKIRIESTIKHELAHWIDDSLNNLHLSKFFNSNKDPKKFYEFLKRGTIDVGLGPVEINAVVNQIYNIKKNFSQEDWDSMSWNRFVLLHPHLEGMNDSFGVEWRNKIRKRMAREGILGKNMK
jgi:hypothetical protein